MSTTTATTSDDLPDWQDATLGTRVRVALWLATKVGEGGRFRKQQLRDAMPGVEQIDRRMRDLRPAGWEIITYRDQPGLDVDELLLQKIGKPVWEREHRAAGLRMISARTRREVMERDGHRCVRCGVLAGESYPDAPGTTARLTLGHVNPHKHGSGATAGELVTECARCNESVKHLTGAAFTQEQVWDRVAALTRKDKEKLLDWLEKGHREATAVEKAASMVFQLPGESRERLHQRLHGALTGA